MNGPWGGREPGGPFGGGRGRHRGLGPDGFAAGPPRRHTRMGRGDIRSAVLALLVDEPQHGYQLLHQIQARSGGVWRPSAGSIYPALKQLSAEGLVDAEVSGGRRVFHLTTAGQRYTAEHEEELAAVWDAVGERFDEDVLEFRELGRQLRTAVQQVGETGTRRQLARGKEILADARKQLYRLLADGDQDTS